MRGLTGLLFFILFILLVSFRQGLRLYVDWLWLAEVGYTRVFTTSLSYKLTLALLSKLFVAALVYLNVKIAAVTPPEFRFTAAAEVVELPTTDLIYDGCGRAGESGIFFPRSAARSLVFPAFC